ncbi:MAG: lipopolysaccharide heptosyltransferase family protein, partial [Gammaproteobacteria bacterium]|nr:lipopolysaccharide heptosyltransferase family protein [Gammaproteobacteria bacterium]
IARLIFRANIPFRMGTSHRWYHYLYCNQRIKLNRKNATLHEAQLNLVLLTPLRITTQYSVPQLKQLIKLSLKPTPLPERVEKLLDPQRFNLIIHALSNNNGREWPLSYYQRLISELPVERFNIFITGAPNEMAQLKPLANKCPYSHNICGQLSLNELIAFMQHCDGLLAGSTGPLHIASALGIKTLGLYPPSQTMNPTRWAPIGQQANYLVAKSGCVKKCLYPEDRTCACMKVLTVDRVKTVLLSWKK